jgi:hypothetical protein
MLLARGSWFRPARGQRCFDFSAGIGGGPLGYNHPLWRRWLRSRLGGLQTPAHRAAFGDSALFFARLFFMRNAFPETPFAREVDQVPAGIDLVDEIDAMTAPFDGPKTTQILRLVSGLDTLGHLPPAARAFRHFLMAPRWMPAGFLPQLFLSRDALNPMTAEPRWPEKRGSGHPLASAFHQISVMTHRPERERNVRKISDLLSKWSKKLPDSCPMNLRGHSLILRPGPATRAKAETQADFPGRVFFGRLSLLSYGESMIILPPVDENPEVLSHRLAELVSFLVP